MRVQFPGSLFLRTLITSLKYPVLAASALGLWSLARVGYTLGYSSGNPKKVSASMLKQIRGPDASTAHQRLEHIPLSDRPR
jgi:hypothetical protein